MATSYRRSPTLSSNVESNRSGSDLWALVRSLYRLGMFGRLRIRHKSISRSTRTKEEENARKTRFLYRRKWAWLYSLLYRAKQLDGSFFEALNAQHIQENEIEKETAQVESDEIGEDDYEVPFDHLTIAPLSSKELEIAYKSLLKTAQFWLGAKETSIERIRDQCHAYMKKVFDVNEKQHSDWLSWTKTHVKPPKQFVRVSIIEGRNLPPKDPNGLSDPYCILGVVRLDPGMLDGKSKTKHVKDLAKDESKLATTAVIPTTLNPKWNEQFDIDIEDVKNEYIQIDIWDSDSEENVGDAIKNIKKVQGLFGLKRYFRQIAQTTVGGTEDDFMGRAHIPLKEISSDGFEGWIQIRTRRQRPKKGEIFVRIQLMADSKSTKSDEAFDEHRKIRRQFVHHEATQLRNRGGGGATCSWNGQLSNRASDLLNQHAIQMGVTDLEVAITDWIVTAEYNEKHGVRGFSLLQALTRLEGEWGKVVALQRDPLDELGKDKTDKLVASIDSYRKWAQKILVKFRHVFSATRKDSPQRFLAFLECLLLSFNLPVAKIHLWENDFATFVESAISESAQYWFTQRYAVAQPIVESEQNEVLSLVEFAHDCVVELYRARQLDKIVFKRLHICFFQITFKQIEKLLSPIVELRIQNATKHLKMLSFDSDSNEFVEVATATFKLYLTIKETFSLRAELPRELVEQVDLFSMHKSFKALVMHWLTLTFKKARNRINRALDLDKIESLSDSVKHSSSAVDTATLLGQMILMWKQLDWPDPPVAYSFLVQLTDHICVTAKHYADCVIDHLKRKSYYDDEGQFDVTEQLCISVNNVEYVRSSLQMLPVDLNWDAALNALEGLAGVAQSRAALRTILRSADEDFENKISIIVERIGERMRVDIEKYSRLLLRDARTVKTENSMNGLMEYLQQNLQILSDGLLDQPFQMILVNMYYVCLNQWYQLVKDRYDLEPYIYKRMSGALKILRSFFFAGGNGLSEESLESEAYRALFRCIERRRWNSPELIYQYLAELEREQAEMKTAERGYLTVQIGYIEKEEKICIKIMNCRDMPPLDSNGLADMYVKVSPFPIGLYGAHSGVQRTKVQKETLTPIFDETFYIPIASDLLRKHKSALVFSVFDWDRFSKDDMAGEGIFSLSAIPAVSSESDVSQLRQTTLKLRLPPEPEGDAFYLLMHRSDNEAVEFVKKRKKRAKLER